MRKKSDLIKNVVYTFDEGAVAPVTNATRTCRSCYCEEEREKQWRSRRIRILGTCTGPGSGSGAARSSGRKRGENGGPVVLAVHPRREAVINKEEIVREVHHALLSRR